MVLGFIRKAGSFLRNQVGKAYQRFKDNPIDFVSDVSKSLTGIDPREDIMRIKESGMEALGGAKQVLGALKQGLSGDIGGALRTAGEGVERTIGAGRRALGQAQMLGAKFTGGKKEE
jgi:hypothetical protein